MKPGPRRETESGRWESSVVTEVRSMPTTIGIDPANQHAALDLRDAAGRSAFSELYEGHAGAAYSLALRLMENNALAEDAVQEAMLRIWKAAPTMRPGNTRAWILRIVA